MANVVVALWTWAAAWKSLAVRPAWALVMAAIGGFALGLELLNQVERAERRAIRRERRLPAKTPVQHRERVLRAVSR